MHTVGAKPAGAPDQARAAIREAQLSLAMDAARMGTWDWDITTNRVTWSEALERIHGLEPGTFPGTFEAYQQDIHPEDRERVLATIERSVHERQSHFLEYRIVVPGGDIRWLEARGRLLTDDQGRPQRLVGLCMDVTERRASDEQLRKTREQLSEHMRLALLTTDVGVALTQASSIEEVLTRCGQAVVDRLGAAFARIWTLNPEQQVLELRTSAGMYTHIDGPHGRVPVGKFKIGLIAQERTPHLTNAVVGDPRVGDQEWARREGMVAFAGYPLLVGDELVGVLAMFARYQLSEADFAALATVANGVALGIQRSRSDAQIRQSDERFHLLSRATNDTIWDWDFASNRVWWNESFATMFGYPPERVEAGPESWTSRIHPDDLNRVVHGIHEAIDGTGTTWSDEYRFRRADGRWADIFDRGIIERDGTGKARRMMGSMMDITERKRAEAELLYQRDLTRTITDNAGSALFMMDGRGHPVFMNPAACDMTGYAGIEEIHERPLHYAVHFKRPDGSPYPMEECPIDQANADIVALKDQREVFCRKDGSLFPISYNVAPIVRDGRRLGAVIEVRDISEEQRAEQALRQRAEELARLAEALERSNRELDQFAYVASHDLKAPLRGIANLSQWIEEDLGTTLTPTVREHMTLLRGRVHRMEALIDGILQYSRAGRQKQEPEPVAVDRLVREVVELLAPPARVRIEIAEGLPVLTTERLPLQQVFLNLIGNAVKHNERPDARVRVEGRRDGQEWIFTVSDNGPGIGRTFHERIWGIFQTLAARDKVEGTGIGLALVKKIVESHGGRVWVESEEGAGATFGFSWRE